MIRHRLPFKCFVNLNGGARPRSPDAGDWHVSRDVAPRVPEPCQFGAVAGVARPVVKACDRAIARPGPDAGSMTDVRALSKPMLQTCSAAPVAGGASLVASTWGT